MAHYKRRPGSGGLTEGRQVERVDYRTWAGERVESAPALQAAFISELSWFHKP